MFLDRFIIGTINYYGKQSAVVFNSKSIIKGVIRVTLSSVGLLVLMGTLGISITPIIASLGITSLAVALALQPTLENFFSGVQLVIDILLSLNLRSKALLIILAGDLHGLKCYLTI